MEPTSYKFFLDSKSAWTAMLEDCRNAQKSIDLERYIFNLDSVGAKFLEVLRERAKAGIRVRIICDMVGSLGFYLSGVPTLLSDEGIDISFFNPISLWRIGNYSSNFFRDHRKILVIDSTVGFIGGTGIDEKTREWRDTEVRIEGPAALKMEHAFAFMREEIRRGRFSRPPHIRYKPAILGEPEIIAHAPHFRARHLRRILIRAIRNAKERVWLTTPYFIPDIRFFSSLRRVAKRGVDVRLLIPEHSDYTFVDNSARSYFTLALKAGIKIYHYHGPMLHAKTAVIDGVFGTVGTLNLDNVSLLFNHEINLVWQNREFARHLEVQFLADLEHSEQLSYAKWVARPLVQKIRELITWPFHKFF